MNAKERAIRDAKLTVASYADIATHTIDPQIAHDAAVVAVRCARKIEELAATPERRTRTAAQRFVSQVTR